MNVKPTFCPECGVWKEYQADQKTMICEACKTRYDLWLRNQELDSHNKES